MESIAKNIGNVLEAVTIPAHPLIANIKEAMLQTGALASLMSGSGPTVFGLTKERNVAEKIAKLWHGDIKMQIVLAQTIQRSENK